MYQIKDFTTKSNMINGVDKINLCIGDKVLRTMDLNSFVVLFKADHQKWAEFYMSERQSRIDCNIAQINRLERANEEIEEEMGN